LPLVRDDVSMRFLFLPADHDPDSYIKEYGAEAFKATAAEAMPLSRFMLDELASHHALNEAEGRAACAHEAKPLLALLPEGTTLRIQIEREFARLVQLTPEELAELMLEVPVPPPPADPHPASAAIAATRHVPGSDFDDPPGFMDAQSFEADTYVSFSPADMHDEPTVAKRGRSSRQNQARSVTPMAKRLLRLLLAH